MEPFHELKKLSLDDLAVRLAGAMEGSLARGWYMGEIIRRQTKAQIDGIKLAAASVIVAAVAVVVSAVVQIMASAG